MSKKTIQGICSVCKKQGLINFEHVPPQSCGNKQIRYTRATLKEIFIPEEKATRKEIMQGGLGYYAFCESCNNQFGNWYVREYKKFYESALKDLKIKTENTSAIVSPFEIYPLKIIKEVVCMFLAVNHNHASNFDKHLLNEFVLDKEKTHLPSQFKIFAYYNRGGKPRIMPFITASNFDTFKIFFEANNLSAITSSLQSEIAFPPLGFVLTYNAKKPDDRLVDITFFADYSYYAKEIIKLALPILPTHTKYPCTYKTKGEIERSMTEATYLK